MACPSMKDYYHERKQLCDDIFECFQLDLEWSQEQYSSDIRKTWVVRCCNIGKLIEKVYSINGESSVYTLNFKLGFDYGYGFTKLVMCRQLENFVRNLIFLWVSSAPENNYNFSIYWMPGNSKVYSWLQRIFYLWSQSRCSLSCYYAWTSPMHLVCLGCWKWIGSCRIQTKVISTSCYWCWLVDYMQMFNIPELHLLLGAGQKLYDAIVATMSEEELAIHELLLKHNNISRLSYHGGAFKGDAMRKITLMV